MSVDDVDSTNARELADIAREVDVDILEAALG
jgi:hypothetical protein